MNSSKQANHGVPAGDIAGYSAAEGAVEGTGLGTGESAGLGADMQALQTAIFTLLAKRSPSATICPSDAARAVYPAADQWRPAMPAVRAVAAQLVAQGRLVVTQGGKVVNITTAKGPIRLRLPPGDSNS